MAKKSVQKTKNQSFVGILVGIAVVGVGVIGYLITSASQSQVIKFDDTIPIAKAQSYLVGREDAPVQVIEFADFECPLCGSFAQVSEPDIRQRLIEPGTVAIRFYDFPLPMHKNTWAASNAAACANEQNQFLAMHDRIFAGQTEWNTAATTKPKGAMVGYAKELGLDVKKFEECYDSQRMIPRIKGNAAEAQARRVDGTPTFIIGDKLYSGDLPYDKFKALVDDELARKGLAPKADAKKTDAKKTDAKK